MNKVNLIKLLRLDLSLTIPYKVKSVYGKDHTQYFRYTIHSKVDYWATDNTSFYFFPTNEHKNMVLVFFSAKEYLGLPDPHQQYLSLYMHKSLAMSSVNTR